MEENHFKAELTIYARTPGVVGLPVQVDIFCQDDEEPVISRAIAGNTQVRFSLPAGRYRVRVRNTAGWNPGGVTDWVCLQPGGHCSLSPVFRGGGAPTPRRPVTVTLTDANYPGITPINGGITVWHSTP